MGFGYRLTCTACGYDSDHLPLGCGEAGYCYTLAVCSGCRTLGTIADAAPWLPDVEHWHDRHCTGCGALLEAVPRPATAEIDGDPSGTPCPKCMSPLAVAGWSLWD